MAVVLIGIVVVVVLVFGIAIAANKRKAGNLASASPGSVRVEAVKAQHVNSTVTMYANAGWTVTDQTTAKSLGSQARVTLTFKKN